MDDQKSATPEPTDPPIIFEGIATLDIGGVDHDVYMTAQVQIIAGAMSRWFGTVTWIGQPPKKFREEFIVDGTEALLSDGRKATIQLPRLPDEEGRFEFQGYGLPPGYVPLYHLYRDPSQAPQRLVSRPQDFEIVTELQSTTPISRFRVWSCRLLNTLALASFTASIWLTEDQWRYFVMGLTLLGVSAVMFTPGRSRSLTPAQDDDKSERA